MNITRARGVMKWSSVAAHQINHTSLVLFPIPRVPAAHKLAWVIGTAMELVLDVRSDARWDADNIIYHAFKRLTKKIIISRVLLDHWRTPETQYFHQQQAPHQKSQMGGE